MPTVGLFSLPPAIAPEKVAQLETYFYTPISFTRSIIIIIEVIVFECIKNVKSIIIIIS